MSSALFTGSPINRQDALARVSEIDAMFERAAGWGSWMVGCANERESLADQFGLEHKYQARTWLGRTD